MTKNYTTPEGEKLVILYDIFTGKTKGSVNGKPFINVSKKTFKVQIDDVREEYIYFAGNVFKGLGLDYKGKMYYISDPIPWYGYILFAVPIIMALTLGNMPSLVDAGYYFIGGAVGGAIGGLFSALVLYTQAFAKKWYFKILLSLALIAITLLILWGLGTAVAGAAGLA